MKDPKRKRSHRYVIRIYKLKFSFDRYDDEIYRLPESRFCYDDIIVERVTDSIGRMRDVWRTILEKYEGYTYCIKDMSTDTILVGGVMDPGDDEFIGELIAGE